MGASASTYSFWSAAEAEENEMALLNQQRATDFLIKHLFYGVPVRKAKKSPDPRSPVWLEVHPEVLNQAILTSPEFGVKPLVGQGGHGGLLGAGFSSGFGSGYGSWSGTAPGAGPGSPAANTKASTSPFGSAGTSANAYAVSEPMPASPLGRSLSMAAAGSNNNSAASLSLNVSGGAGASTSASDNPYAIDVTLLRTLPTGTHCTPSLSPSLEDWTYAHSRPSPCPYHPFHRPSHAIPAHLVLSQASSSTARARSALSSPSTRPSRSRTRSRSGTWPRSSRWAEH